MPKKHEIRSRALLWRVRQIHDELMAKRYPNCADLMRITEVGRRTILRDIDFMRNQMELPVDYYHPEFGYHYSKPVEKFPIPAVTEADVFAVFVAHSAVNQYRGTQPSPCFGNAWISSTAIPIKTPCSPSQCDNPGEAPGGLAAGVCVRRGMGCRNRVGASASSWPRSWNRGDPCRRS